MKGGNIGECERGKVAAVYAAASVLYLYSRFAEGH